MGPDTARFDTGIGYSTRYLYRTALYLPIQNHPISKFLLKESARPSRACFREAFGRASVRFAAVQSRPAPSSHTRTVFFLPVHVPAPPGVFLPYSTHARDAIASRIPLAAQAGGPALNGS